MEMAAAPQLNLPGFRFHPTEEELLACYLRPLLCGGRLRFDIIGSLNIYLHDPWELPGLAMIGEREWYFFVPRDRRTGSCGRPNRTTERGFWKATGSDRPIRSSKEPRHVIGMKKTLVFYGGRAPRGTKTDWIMNEYRLQEASTIPLKEDMVLCKVYRKATSLKELEKRAAKEEDAGGKVCSYASNSDGGHCSEPSLPLDFYRSDLKEELEMHKEVTSPPSTVAGGRAAAAAAVRPPELQVPKSTVEWSQQDPFLLRSPWMEQWCANILNF